MEKILAGSKIACEQYRKVNAEYAVEVVPENLRHLIVQEEPGKYKCEACQAVFATSLQAMKQHAEKHKEKKFIKIGETIGKQKSLVPDTHHYNRKKGESSFGKNVKLCRIVIPEDAKMKNSVLFYAEGAKIFRCIIRP